MGKTIVYQGGPGAGQHTKMVNQVLIATNMIGVCEALLYAYRAGLDLNTVLQSVTSGAANSWSLSNLGPRIIHNNFDPGFFVEHFIKDMGIALEEAERMGLALPGLALAHQLYLAVQAHGHGRQGTHALQLALASLANLDWLRREVRGPGGSEDPRAATAPDVKTGTCHIPVCRRSPSSLSSGNGFRGELVTTYMAMCRPLAPIRRLSAAQVLHLSHRHDLRSPSLITAPLGHSPR